MPDWHHHKYAKAYAQATHGPLCIDVKTNLIVFSSPGSDPCVAQGELGFIHRLTIWLWKYTSADMVYHYTVIAVCIDREWQFLHAMHKYGWAQLLVLVAGTTAVLASAGQAFNPFSGF